MYTDGGVGGCRECTENTIKNVQQDDVSYSADQLWSYKEKSCSDGSYIQTKEA